MRMKDKRFILIGARRWPQIQCSHETMVLQGPMSDMTTLSVTLWEQIISHLPGKHLGSVRCVCQTSRQAVENYVERVVITETSIDEAPDLSRWPNLQTIIITDNMKAPYPEMMSLGPQVNIFLQKRYSKYLRER